MSESSTDGESYHCVFIIRQKTLKFCVCVCLCVCCSLATGITETIAQLVSGWVTDRNLFHKYHYHKAYLILCGLVNLLSPLATSYILLMVYAVFFAIFCGGYMALLLPVLVRTSVQSLRIIKNHLRIVFFWMTSILKSIQPTPVLHPSPLCNTYILNNFIHIYIKCPRPSILVLGRFRVEFVCSPCVCVGSPCVFVFKTCMWGQLETLNGPFCCLSLMWPCNELATCPWCQSSFAL